MHPVYGVTVQLPPLAAVMACASASALFGFRVNVSSANTVIPTRSAWVSSGGVNPAAGVTCADAMEAPHRMGAMKAKMRRKESSLLTANWTCEYRVRHSNGVAYPEYFACVTDLLK